MTVLIAGGGIGGLTAALTLHAAGIACEVFEQSLEPRELGVGINLLPRAVGVLARLGLLDDLDRCAIRTGTLILATRRGEIISRSPRGLDAGNAMPQFSIHRGKLLSILVEAVQNRLGRDKLHAGHRLLSFENDDGGVTASFLDRTTGAAVSRTGPCLIGADGIHSQTRAIIHPHEPQPRWSGYMLWRGATDWPVLEDGRTMLVAGGLEAKFVFYPIAALPANPPYRLTNWAVWIHAAAIPPTGVHSLEDWTKRSSREDLAALVRTKFEIPFIDVEGMVRKTSEVLELPLLDRQPLGRWTKGCATLLGDAAHPMYPVGSNGATQAIIDAEALASALSGGAAVGSALQDYEAGRRDETHDLIVANRFGGPERIIDLVEERAPSGFDTLEDVLSPSEFLEFGLS